MNLTLIIPDTVAPRVLDALAVRHGYTGVDALGAAQTKQQFVRARLMQWIRDEVREHEQNEAAATARQTTPALEL